jgi:hypothetical protein
MRNNNAQLGARELREALNLGAQDTSEFKLSASSVSPADILAMSEAQLNLAAAYVVDRWEEAAEGSGDHKLVHADRPSPDATSNQMAHRAAHVTSAEQDNGASKHYAYNNGGRHLDAARSAQDMAAKKYHRQIDEQIDEAHSYLLSRFGEQTASSAHSIRTIAVFTVHAASLVAWKRHYPNLHRGTFNGLTHVLSCNTPNPLPDVKPPSHVLVSYIGRDAAFMHDNHAIFETRGVQAVVGRLLSLIGGTSDRDSVDLANYINHTADVVAKTYMAYIGRGVSL